MQAVKTQERIEIGPQWGPQTQFVGSYADIVIYGGAAGGGKTYGLLLDPLRHYNNGLFGGVIFRKTKVQVRNEGGLWDTSMELYTKLAGKPRENMLEWRFPSGMGMSFASLEYEKDVFNYQGSQIPWIGFDELTHFSEKQFFYMVSRNRSTSGAKPRIRATCNPDPDSWVKTFIRWWLDDEGRFPRKDRAGQIRYFIRVNDEMHWGDSKEELYQKFGQSDDIQPKSVTFIPSSLEDNKILMSKDPTYRGNLLALSRVDRMRLLGGDWLVRESAGMMFQRQWFKVVDALPSGWIRAVRYWDRAATKPSEQNRDPDWTRGLLMYQYPNGLHAVVDIRSMQDTPLQVENLVKNTAHYDGHSVMVVGEQDPGSAGVADAGSFTRLLNGFNVRTRRPTSDKATRAKPVSAQSEAGNIMVVRAPWNDAFFSELENFPEGVHDDIVDTLSGAYNELTSEGLSTFDVL